ncbi:MAG: methyltransferase domain-containing protein [Leptolyngbyaceae cyanobacterium SL_7_1]|nr:methyltransferase domain-containing protein [Leptolyngbyaceae cyanobacterium SL_7_1]
MAQTGYIFTDTQHIEERDRLQTIERVFDPASRRRIATTGITNQWRCLEVGAGAGSIAQWMAEQVGEHGKVVAIDVNTRFLTAVNAPNLEVHEADIRTFTSPEPFDLIHARYVLIHNADFRVALTNMLTLLKPGGWLVLEEPDFSAARAIVGEVEICAAVDRVNQSILQLFADRAMDGALGVKLPAILQSLGVELAIVEDEAHLCAGGAGVATVMKLSTLQLAEKYMATGKTTAPDIQAYCQFADDPQAWGIYYATIGAIGRKIV